MKTAAEQNALYREQPFVIAQKMNQIEAAWNGEETVLVQGIIDAYFIEDDEIVLVDYKTDKVSPGRTGSDRSVSYTVGGLRSGIGTNAAEKSKGNIYLFIYTEKDDTVIMKISRRTERLHSPSCGIFVFESLADEFTESD